MTYYRCFSQFIVEWKLGITLGSSYSTQLLKKGIAKYCAPENIKSEQ